MGYSSKTYVPAQEGTFKMDQPPSEVLFDENISKLRKIPTLTEFLYFAFLGWDICLIGIKALSYCYVRGHLMTPHYMGSQVSFEF